MGLYDEHANDGRADFFAATSHTTSLISAEEWVSKYEDDKFSKPRLLQHRNGDYVRAIQLNALKAAAEIATRMQESEFTAGGWICREILSLAKQVEEGKQICDGKESK